MFGASTNSGGQAAGFPTADMTPGSPPVVIPYPSMAMISQAKGSTCSDKVRIGNKKTCVKTTEISRTMGDEAGVQSPKGSVSGSNMGSMQYNSGSSVVSAEGEQMVCQLAMTAHNGSNANLPVGSQVSPSQTAVTIMV